MNEIESAMIKYGIPMPAFRAALRDATAAMIAAGPGTTAGIHGVGVFHVATLRKRFVQFDGDVYSVAERDVLKLRPSKGDATKLDESPLVEFATKHAYTADLDFTFESTSKSAQFELQLPSSRSGETWKLKRYGSAWNGVYVFAHETQDFDAIASGRNPVFDVFDDWQGGCLERSLTAWRDAVNASGYSLDRPNFHAQLDAGGMADIESATGGPEALAHVRARALT